MMKLKYTESEVPYLVWFKSHLRIHQYSNLINYKKGDQVTIGRSIFRSTSNNNKNNNPLQLRNWIQIA